MIKVNDIVKIDSWKQGLRVKAVSEDEKWIVASKRAMGSFLYSIINTKEKVVGTDDYIFGKFDYNKIEDCEKALQELINETTKIGRRKVDYQTLFVNGKKYEKG